jgi:hypothetical protein
MRRLIRDLIISHEPADAHCVTWSNLRHEATLATATAILDEVEPAALC